MTHTELIMRAEKWLRNQNCSVAFREGFNPATGTGELPDAVGWRDGICIVIECKVSRADFRADQKKPHRIAPNLGMGDWRFYLAPKGLVRKSELPKGWGLLEIEGRRIRKTAGVPPNTRWHSDAPFSGNRIAQVRYLTSALRRFAVRGMLETVYEPIGRGA